jgi:hypothetical protein
MRIGDYFEMKNARKSQEMMISLKDSNESLKFFLRSRLKLKFKTFHKFSNSHGVTRLAAMLLLVLRPENHPNA